MDCLSASQLSCIKQDRELFEGLSLQVCAGEALHVVGDNGAGKTSLLRILAGLSQPQRGCVQWNRLDISEQPELFNLDVLYLGHKLALNGHLTARENLQFWSGLHQLPSDSDFYALLAHMGLTGLEDVPVANLSAGQQRRVSLCRVWLKQAKLLILDEPFNALDVDSRALLENKLQQHVNGGGLLVLTSHWQLPEVFDARELRLEYNI